MRLRLVKNAVVVLEFGCGCGWYGIDGEWAQIKTTPLKGVVSFINSRFS